MSFARRPLLLGALALGLAAAAPALAAPAMDVDMSMGAADAPITVVEYGSASCPHCAHFNNDIFPAFKAKYIDTGRVRFVFREFLTQPVELAAAGFLLARCAGKDHYFQALDAVFHAQAHIYETHDAAGPLFAIAKQFGMSQADAEACINDPDAQRALNARVSGFAKTDHIDSTPTFIVGEERLEGVQTLAQLGDAIDRATAAARRHGDSAARPH
jgi:protein-disulfide isomerase